jgi:hypothetical protein
MKAGTKVELPLWLGEMLAVAGGYVFAAIFIFAFGSHSVLCGPSAAGADTPASTKKAQQLLIISKNSNR